MGQLRGLEEASASELEYGAMQNSGELQKCASLAARRGVALSGVNFPIAHENPIPFNVSGLQWPSLIFYFSLHWIH